MKDHLIKIIRQNGLNITLQKLGYPLNGFVSHLFEIKGNPTLGSQRIFPREGSEIIFNLSDPFKIKSSITNSIILLEAGLVMGNRSGYIDFQPENKFHICGIRFNLNGFYGLTGIDQNEFGDSFHSLNSVLTYYSGFLYDLVLSQDSIKKRFLALENWITSLYQQRKDYGHFIVPYLIQAINQNQFGTISELEKTSGYSRKHLFHSFKKETGLNLKAYQRTNRFHLFLKRIKHNPKWQESAFDLGFYDQSHMIKDVSFYTGLTPKQLIKSPFDPIGKVLPIKMFQ